MMSRSRSFTNASIVPVRVGKPHIVMVAEYWRVSCLHRSDCGIPHTRVKYAKAHDLARKLNDLETSHD
jgi:hypothetical protein